MLYITVKDNFESALISKGTNEEIEKDFAPCTISERGYSWV
jgi:hypothetical protein